MKLPTIPVWLIRIFALLMSIPLFFQIFAHARADVPEQPRFSVTVVGQGPDVIMIPGLASSAEVWRNETNRLKAQYRLHLVQIAGFAGAPVAGNATTPMLVPIRDGIAAYIQQSHLHKPVIVGHSLGGLLAMMIADAHPELVDRLVIVDSLPFFGMLSGPQATVESVTPVAARVRDQLLGQSQADFAKGEAQAMAGLMKSQGGDARAALAAAQASDHSVVAHAMYEDWTTDMRPRLAGLKAKVLVLYAFDTTMGLPQAVIDGLYGNAYGALADKQLVRIDGSYHFIQIDQPDRFHEELGKFLGARP
jgi:pimeloyl-ACP methyl ester carboxylesterase